MLHPHVFYLISAIVQQCLRLGAAAATKAAPAAAVTGPHHAETLDDS